jgi:hypothetical protein
MCMGQYRPPYDEAYKSLRSTYRIRRDHREPVPVFPQMESGIIAMDEDFVIVRVQGVDFIERKTF